MKFLVGLFYFSLFFFSFSQIDSMKIYLWEEAKNCSPDSVYGISFSKLKLKEIPSELINFNKIKVLDLSNNKLSYLPDFLSTFHFLKKIDLSKNKFDTLPQVIYQIKSLQYLKFSRNNVSYIDSTIKNLSELKYIDFWDNPIENFPEAFIKLKKLKIIHAEGIRYGPKFQAYWKEIIPNATIYFDAPCNCKE